MDTLFENAQQLIDAAQNTLLSSVDEDGFPQTRALLAPRKREGLKYFYFSTNTSSQKVRHFLDNPKACLYFFDPRTFVGVMLIGSMEVLQDHASRALVWRDGDTLYYPQGIDDPDCTALKFTAKTLRYYSDFQTHERAIT